MAKLYFVPKGDGSDYQTNSIVSARAYAVKMIEKYPKAMWWDIYTTKNDRRSRFKPYTSVVFYGKPEGYKWHHDGKKTNMYANGKLRRD